MNISLWVPTNCFTLSNVKNHAYCRLCRCWHNVSDWSKSFVDATIDWEYIIEVNDIDRTHCCLSDRFQISVESIVSIPGMKFEQKRNLCYFELRKVWLTLDLSEIISSSIWTISLNTRDVHNRGVQCSRDIIVEYRRTLSCNESNNQ